MNVLLSIKMNYITWKRREKYIQYKIDSYFNLQVYILIVRLYYMVISPSLISVLNAAAWEETHFRKSV